MRHVTALAQCFRRTKARDEESERPIRGGNTGSFRILDCQPLQSFSAPPFKRDNESRARYSFSLRAQGASALRIAAMQPRLLYPLFASLSPPCRRKSLTLAAFRVAASLDAANARASFARSPRFVRTVLGNCRLSLDSQLPSSIQGLPRGKGCLADARSPFIAFLLLSSRYLMSALL